jgi:hypothetical protein
MRCRVLLFIGLFGLALAACKAADVPCTPAGCRDKFTARFVVNPSILTLNGGTMSLCRDEVCTSARIRFDSLDSALPLEVTCAVRPPPTIPFGPTVDCVNELTEPAKDNFVENVISILYEAPQEAVPVEMSVFTIRLTDAAGKVMAERTGGLPLFAGPLDVTVSQGT